MSNLRRARRRPSSASDHERARRLAAQGLYETLEAEETAWLDAHLDECPACEAIADDYAAQRLALRALPKPEPPRDLWARTAAALDEEDRRARRRVGFRSLKLGRAPLIPYGALAGALVVAVVVGSSLLAGGGPVATPAGSAAPPTTIPSIAAAPTPVSVAASSVAWFAPQDDGTYALNIAPVDRVCPAEAQPDCAPIDGSARQLIRLSAEPRAVLRSPQQSQLAVMEASTNTVGGAIYMVPVAATDTPPASPGPTGTPLAIESAPPTPSPFPELSPSPSFEASAPPSTTPAPTETPGPTIEGTPEPTPEPTTSASPGESGTPTPTPSSTSGGAIAIISDVIVVGETAAYSPDGTWFAFSARPADGSQGPDIYVWHVGDLLARPLTTDHSSVFSSWLGGLVLGSRAIPDPILPAPDASLVPDGSLVPGESVGPEVSVAPDASLPPVEPSASGSTDNGVSPPVDASPSIAPTPMIPTGQPTSFLVDPATGARLDLAVPAWRPIVDPFGRYVIYWSGSLGFDASSSSWAPLDGQLLIAPWSWLIGPTLQPSPSPSEGPALPVPTDALASPLPTIPLEMIVTPQPTAPPEVIGAPDASTAPEATPSPTILIPIPTGSPTLSPAGSVGTGPDGGYGGAPSPSPSPFTPLVAPEPLMPPTSASVAAGAIRDWDVRWDPTGTRLAVWVSDPVDPRIGRLSLLAIDGSTGRVDLARTLLIETPALSGYSIADGRIAWATPPGQDGEGSRLQILAWTLTGQGQLDSQPSMGSDAVVVVR